MAEEKRKPKVLIVDDELHQMIPHIKAMKRAGWVVVTGRSPMEGHVELEKALELGEEVNAIIVDAMIPGIFMMLVEVARTNPEISIILVDVVPDQNQRLVENYGWAQISKVDEPAAMIAKIKQRLGIE